MAPRDSGVSPGAAVRLWTSDFFLCLHVGCPLGFAPEAALEDWGLPCEGQVLPLDSSDVNLSP